MDWSMSGMTRTSLVLSRSSFRFSDRPLLAATSSTRDLSNGCHLVVVEETAEQALFEFGRGQLQVLYPDSQPATLIKQTCCDLSQLVVGSASQKTCRKWALIVGVLRIQVSVRLNQDLNHTSALVSAGVVKRASESFHPGIDVGAAAEDEVHHLELVAVYSSHDR